MQDEPTMDVSRRPGTTGVANDDTFSVEVHGINTIPDADRHGTARELFFVWAAPNTNYVYLILGALIISFGLGFWPAVVAILVAHAFYLFLGLGAIPGPKAGSPTLVVSRSAFGLRGNSPYAFLSWITTVGWEAVWIVIPTLALVQLVGLANISGSIVKVVALLLVALVTFSVAIFGHATIVLIQKYLTYLLGAGMIVLAIFVFPHAHFGGFQVSALAAQNPLSTWILAVEVMLAGSAVSWLNYPADYARYLPKNAPSKGVALWTALGPVVPAIVISVIGAAAATAVNMNDPIGGLKTLVPLWFFAIFLVILVGGSVANNFLNTYSSGMSLLALGARLRRTRAVLVDAAIATAMSVYALFISNFITSFENFLALMVIWLVPWFAVYFADIVIRRNTYDADALHAVSGGIYWYKRGWNIPGLIAFICGAVGAALFTNATIFRGALVGLVGGADISIFVGGVVAFVIYVVLSPRSQSDAVARSAISAADGQRARSEPVVEVTSPDEIKAPNVVPF